MLFLPQFLLTCAIPFALLCMFIPIDNDDDNRTTNKEKICNYQRMIREVGDWGTAGGLAMGLLNGLMVSFRT